MNSTERPTQFSLRALFGLLFWCAVGFAALRYALACKPTGLDVAMFLIVIVAPLVQAVLVLLAMATLGWLIRRCW